jgi:hypothetical protein
VNLPNSQTADAYAFRPTPNERLQVIATFAALAGGYCDWCEQRCKGRNPGKAAAQWLSRLNDDVFNLPKISHREKLPELPNWREVFNARQAKRTYLRMFNWHYRKVFDPDSNLAAAPLMGWALDDLADVYVDLSHGLALYESGYPLNASNHWQSTYANHWGMHATGALVGIYFNMQRAIHE